MQTGNRVIKPKKASLIKQQQIKKVCLHDDHSARRVRSRLTRAQKHTAGLAAMTEKSLASRAGHLEMLHGGKKDKKKQTEQPAKQQPRKQTK